MADIEREFRGGPRVVRMDIQSRYARQRRPSGLENPPSQRTLWGVFDGGRERTRLLYVFSGPGRLAGTALLIHDSAAASEPDEMWLYLRSFEIFKKIDAGTQQVLVPGTALSYEDSRGFIPVDKYRFSFPDSDATQPGVVVLACPRSDTLRDQLGYGSLLLRVDPEKKIVRGVRYQGLGGRPLKTYTLVRDVQVGDRFFPGEVRLEHLAEGFTTEIGYEYWPQEAPPPTALFEPSLEQTRFIDRLTDYLTQIGQGARIREELAQADEELRRFEDRLRRIQEAERLGKPFRE